MRSTVILIVLAVIAVLRTLSQPCLPDGITFTTQAQIDSFQINYPNCTEIEGDVYIFGEIWNLHGLSVVTSIGGHLRISNNDTLLNLNGLESLTTIGDNLTIGFWDWGWNSSLNSIASLSSLDSVGGGISIAANLNLISLVGLEGITAVQYLTIHFNNSLVNLQGLENITHIQGDLGIADNASLTSLIELENIVSIDGMLYIESNHSISSLTGLHNIDAGSISDLFIGYNNALTTCEVQTICDYLVNPTGSTFISGNATGCSSQEEVEEACESVSVNEIKVALNCKVSPNPFTTSTTFEYTLEKPSDVMITIYNSQGQVVERMQERQDKGVQRVEWGAEGLPAGMYYYILQTGSKAENGKLIKMR